jgi:two-component system response regulator
MNPTTRVWLVVEDDDDDFFLFRRACSSLTKMPVIHWEKDGAAAQKFLQSHSDTPSLIISDIKMPKVDGLELLKWVRQQPLLNKLPFIILSSSNSQQDRTKAERLGANKYLVKPTDLRALGLLLRQLDPLTGS